MNKKQDPQINIKLNLNGQVKNIKIYKISMLQQQIDKFLRQNKLEIKYKEHILKHIRNQLYKEDIPTKHQQSNKATIANHQRSIYQNKQPIQSDKNIQKSQKQENGSIIDAIQQESIEGSRLIYQKWKNIQKKKNQDYTDSKNTKKPVIKTETSHYPPQHMYYKGLLYKKKTQDKLQTLFHQLYPFKRTKHEQLNKDQQNILINRLYNSRHNECQHQQHYKSYNQSLDKNTNNSPSPKKYDKIKQQMKIKDNIIDYQIFKILKNNSFLTKRQNQ